MEVKMVIKSNSTIIVGCCAIIISETNTLCEVIVCFYLPYVTAFNSFFPYPIIIQGQRAFNTFLCCRKIRIIVFATSSLSRSLLRIIHVLQPGGNYRQKNMNTCSWMLILYAQMFMHMIFQVRSIINWTTYDKTIL